MRTGEMFIEGTLTPISWDPQGSVRQLSVYTDEGEDIILLHHFPQKRIGQLLNKRVRIFGREVGEIDEARLFMVSKTMKKGEGGNESSNCLSNVA